MSKAEIPASQPQHPRIPRHLQIPTPHTLALAVDQLAQAFPVHRAGGLPAVQLLVVDDGPHGVGVGGGAHRPFDRVAGLAQRAFARYLDHFIAAVASDLRRIAAKQSGEDFVCAVAQCGWCAVVLWRCCL